MTEQVEKTIKTDVSFVNRLITLFREIQTLNEDVKSVKEEAKEEGYDVALLSKVAKAIADYKQEEILSKNDSFAELVDKFYKSNQTLDL